MTQTETCSRPSAAEVDLKSRDLGAKNSWFRSNAGLIVVIVCATASALVYNFVTGHPKTTLMYDARSYLWTASRFSQFFIDLTHLQWSPQLLSDVQFREHVFNDGPLYTGFIGTVFALFQHVPVEKDWFKIEIIQSILHGFTAGFVYLITLRTLKPADADNGTACGAGASTGALASGLIWALYPAANLGSGFLYTEPLVVFAIAAFVWSAVSNTANRWLDILAGVFAGFLMLLKPALVPAALVSCLARAFFSPKKAAAISAMAVALVLTLAPWALYTQFVCGKMQVTTPRFAGYNMAMGSDTESEGRLVIPCTPLTNIFRDDEKPIYFVMSQWKNHTGECLQMTARKLTRLLAFPWNDYRHKFLGLDAFQQRTWHLVLLFAGLAGFVLAALTRKAEKNTMPLMVAMAFMWTPLIYLLFESNSRYGFTIMPMYTVFAGYLIAQMVGFKQNKNWKPLALSVVAASVLLVAILQAGKWASPEIPDEMSIQVPPGKALVTGIDLSRVKQPNVPYEALIIVDGERSVESASVMVNGHSVGKPLEHLRYFDSSIYDGFYVNKEMAHFMRAEPEDFRQWRIARIPKEWLNWSGSNEVKLTGGERASTVYGDNAERVEFLPSFRHYCPNKLCNAATGFETRLSLLRPSRNVAQSNRLADTKLSGSSRVRIAIVLDSARNKRPAESVQSFPYTSPRDSGETLIFSEAVKPELFPIIMRSPTTPGAIQTNRFVMDHVAPAVQIKLPMPASGDNVFRIRLTGEVKTAKKGKVSPLVANGRFAVLSKMPPALEADSNWRSFTLDDRMPVKLLRENANAQPSVALALYPGEWLDESGYGASKASSDALFRGLKLEVWSSKELNLAGKQIFVY